MTTPLTDQPTTRVKRPSSASSQGWRRNPQPMQTSHAGAKPASPRTGPATQDQQVEFDLMDNVPV